MANKNTKRRQVELSKANRGVKAPHKPKKQPFPSKDGMSMADQRKFFYGLQDR